MIVHDNVQDDFLKASSILGVNRVPESYVQHVMWIVT